MRGGFGIWTALVALAASGVAGCTATNQPINAIALTAPASGELLAESPGDAGATVVALAFSGGGTRAAAFSYGLLKELEATPLPGDEGRSMLRSVRFVSGVSGGSVAAAYYGLKGPDGFGDFRERFLVRNAEEGMRTSVANPVNLVGALTGGVNGRGTFALWLDRNLFGGARFRDLLQSPHATTWINASDIYNHAPFIFEPETFRALCSDIGNLPVSEAVAASAAVPIVFSPIVLSSHGSSCSYDEPGWLTAATTDPSTPAALKTYARAVETYRDPSKLAYVKLLDGGITDNFGLTGLSLARAKSQTPFGPLSAHEAVKLRRMAFFVANAGRAPDAKWGNRVAGPGALDLVMAVTDTAIDSGTRAGFDTFRLSVEAWHKDLVEWRCGLSAAEARRLGAPAQGWNCRDVKLFVGELRFDQLDSETAARLNKVATRLKLPVADVDLTIEAGRRALATNPAFRALLLTLEGRPDGVAGGPSALVAKARAKGFDRLTPD